MRLWRWIVAGVVALFAGLDLAFVLLDFDPDHLRLALVVGLGAAVVVLVWASLGESPGRWSAEPQQSVRPAGADLQLGAYVRLIESHLTSATADPALRDRLAVLCDERLARRHGLTRDDPAARDLLGDALLADLAAPPRRLGRREIEAHLTRIEQL
jgi:hypothetical protein